MNLNEQQIKFNKMLYTTYNGQVICTENYSTINASLLFECKNCYCQFYSKCTDVISPKEYKRHLCYHSISDACGNRKKKSLYNSFKKEKVANVWKTYLKSNDVYITANENDLKPEQVHIILKSK